MYVENLVTGFYNIVAKQRVLMFVNYDIDAICAAKILQSVFRYDTTIYTLIPVCTLTDLVNGYMDHKQNIKFVILINCGGTIDIVNILDPSEDVIFFIADNHRPTHICNIYSDFQIRMLCKSSPEEGIPDFEDIYRDDEEDSDSNDENFDENEITEESRLRRKREKRLWIENKRRILFEYVQFSYYSRSSSILMYELSWQLHKDNIDLLWWGIVGVTEQLIFGKVEMVQYVDDVKKIESYVGRLCPRVTENSHNISTQSSISSNQNNYVNSGLRIDREVDLQLALYRHWTVESSLRYTMYTAVALKLWAIKGEKRLQQLLVEMGLPLAQSKQQYSAMDLDLRKEFHTMIEKMSVSRNLRNITYPSFTLLQGFRSKYQATDYVYSLLALLSNHSRGRSLRDCFYDAMDALSRSKRDLLNDGIEASKKFLMSMFKHVQNALDMKQVIPAGPFFYVIIQEGTINAKYYSNPNCLLLFANFILKAYVAASRKSSATRIPLIASAPLEEEGFCIVIGIPPVAETTHRSFFGKAFEQVAEKTGCPIALDYYDSTIVKMQVTDRPKVFDALTVLLS